MTRRRVPAFGFVGPIKLSSQYESLQSLVTSTNIVTKHACCTDSDSDVGYVCMYTYHFCQYPGHEYCSVVQPSVLDVRRTGCIDVHVKHMRAKVLGHDPGCGTFGIRLPVLTGTC